MACLEKTYTINGYDIDVSYEQSSVDNLFRPLIAHLRQLQKQKQGRLLVFLAAPPGVGKTTLSMFLQDLSKDEEGVGIQSIGMDGFHRYQAYLTSHTMMREGKEVPMVSLKGSLETFDVEKLRAKILQLSNQSIVKWPLYVRSLHNPEEDKIEVTSDIVLLEGNYLLLKDESWEDLMQYCDYSIFITTELAFLEERLITRKMMGGTSREDAYTFYKNSDAYNAQYILENSQKADLTLEMKKDGTYHKVNN